MRVAPGELAIILHELGPVRSLVLLDPEARGDHAQRVRHAGLQALAKVEALVASLDDRMTEEQKRQFFEMFDSMTEADAHAKKEGGRMLTAAIGKPPV